MNFSNAELLAKLSRDPLLVEREQTHGSFSKNAAHWDGIMFALEHANFRKPEHRLCITMICLKIARACQTPDVRDHWDDIAGYAKLASEACD